MKRNPFDIMGEIAYLDFVLRHKYDESKKPKSPILMMIDKACGREEMELKEAKRIIKRIEKLQKILDQSTF